VGVWHFGETQGGFPGGELSAVTAIGRQLEVLTGLPVEQQNGGLRIPAIGETLWGFDFNDRTVTA
jgi:hypothetical protein